MWIYELAALGAATLWAMGGLISAGPSGHLGAIHFNRIRITFTAVLLALVALATGRTLGVDQAGMMVLALSGLVGVFIGDTLLFLALNRLGPRRTSILFSMNAPIAVALGWMVLGERLSIQTLGGICLSVIGVALAILFGKRPSQLHEWEAVRGPLWAGVLLGLGAALCQALGSLIARPVMEAGADPIWASSVRLALSALCLNVLVQFNIRMFRAANGLTLPVFLRTCLSGIIGMGLGVTLLLFALSGGEVGIISTLSATSPAIMLPLIWLRTGERPALAAWVGAALVCIGTGLIFLG